MAKRNCLLFYIGDNSKIDLALPILEWINRPSILLCNSDIDITNQLPNNICLFTYNKNEYSRQVGFESIAKKFNLYSKLENIYESIFRKINIEGLILFDEKDSTEYLLKNVGKNFGVKSINLSQYLNSCFSNKSQIHGQDSLPMAYLNQIVEYINIKLPIKYDKNIHKLNLGCGQYILPNWINVDLFIRHPKILPLDISKKFPFADNSFSFVFTEHTIEHLDYSNQKTMLQECFRVLTPGGILRIATPNLEFLLDLCKNPDKPLNKRYIDWSISNFDYAYIDNPSLCDSLAIHIVNKFMRSWGHRYIHNTSSLEELVTKIGFSNPITCKPGESQHYELSNVDRHHLKIPKWANEIETMIYEFQKPLNH